jgi:hypothetical protein
VHTVERAKASSRSLEFQRVFISSVPVVNDYDVVPLSPVHSNVTVKLAVADPFARRPVRIPSLTAISMPNATLAVSGANRLSAS